MVAQVASARKEAPAGLNPLTMDVFESDNPYPLLNELRSYAPIAWIDEAQVWAVTGYQLAIDVLNKKALRSFLNLGEDYDLSTANSFERSVRWATVLSSHGDRHQRLRPLFASLMIPRNISNLKLVTENTAHALIDAVIERGSMDLIPEYGMALPFEVLSDLLHVPPEIRGQGIQWTAAISEGIKDVALGVRNSATLNAANEATINANTYFGSLLKERKLNPGDNDNLDQMIRAAEKIGLSDEELCANAWLLYIGGHETTGSTIGTSILRLNQNPHVLKRVKADPSLLPAVIDEALRFDPAAFATGRTADEDTVIADQVIRKGEKVVVLIAAANRDPAEFPDPDRFDIDRGKNKPLTFGWGAHLCAGQLMARMNAEVALAVLHERLPDLKLEDNDPAFKPCLAMGLPSLKASWRVN